MPVPVTTTNDVVMHQIRQTFLYTFYFSGCQLLAFEYDLGVHWTFCVFITLLGISFYQDAMYFDQDSIPESILMLRIWTNNFLVITSNMIFYVLERGHFIVIHEQSGATVGRPQQMIMDIPKVGIEIVDDILLGGGYYLYYFGSFAMCRLVIAQFRYVKRLLQVNLNWTSDDTNVNVMDSEHENALEQEVED